MYVICDTVRANTNHKRSQVNWMRLGQGSTNFRFDIYHYSDVELNKLLLLITFI